MNAGDVEELEIELLLEGIFRRYGVDFRNYSRASVKRRIGICREKFNVERFSDLIPELLNNKEAFNSFLLNMSVGVTEMFRDPEFFLTFREKVIPVMKTYPFVKIWHAGCSTGEEVYSLAIILQEESFLDRSVIYATDFNALSLDIAQKGIYSMEDFKHFEENYRATGAKSRLGDYCKEKYGFFKLSDQLKKNIVFSTHNLASDGVFGEMNVIICRNVLIYFDKMLQNRVFHLFRDSLSPLGFLCLGTKETVKFSDVADEFDLLFKKEKIFRKISSTNGQAIL